jgi:hypothetical protein
VTVRARQTPASTPTPCDAARTDPTAVTLAAADVHARSPETLSVEFHPDVLDDRAFGTLQLQVVDAATGLAGNWVSLPGTFARAPRVAEIVCPLETDSTCRLYGTGLAAIDAVGDPPGAFVAPHRDCPPTAKGVRCLYVPRLAHFTLHLVDAGATETLPDSIVGAAPDERLR